MQLMDGWLRGEMTQKPSAQKLPSFAPPKTNTQVFGYAGKSTRCRHRELAGHQAERLRSIRGNIWNAAATYLREAQEAYGSVKSAASDSSDIGTCHGALALLRDLAAYLVNMLIFCANYAAGLVAPAAVDTFKTLQFF